MPPGPESWISPDRRFDPPEQRNAVVLAQLVIELSLLRFELAIHCLLGFGRQFTRHLLLGSAQDKRPQRVTQQAARFLSGLRIDPPATLKALAAPSIPGLRNSNRVHSSPRWFSTGVPLIARRCRPRRSRAAFDDSVSAFLTTCASSSTT